MIERMLIPYPLDGLFGSARARVLDAMFAVDSDCTVRQIARMTQMAPSTASAALSGLEGAGVLLSREIGSAIAYRINRDHYAIEALFSLTHRAADLQQTLVSTLTEAIGVKPRSIILFGSVARGEDSPASDVDVLVVAPDRKRADLWQERAYEGARAVSLVIGRNVNVIVSGPPTATMMRREFWRNIAREGRVLSGVSTARLRAAG